MSRNMLNGAQVIVDYLIQEKVPQVFGLCGHGNIQFIDALYERSADIIAQAFSILGNLPHIYLCRHSHNPSFLFWRNHTLSTA